MPFQKGHRLSVGNKGGRPRKHPDLKAKCKDLAPVIVDRLVKIITDNKERARDQIAACNLVLSYGFGRPPQSLDVTQTYDATGAFLEALREINGRAQPAKLLNPPPINAANELNLGRMPAHEVLPEGWEKD